MNVAGRQFLGYGKVASDIYSVIDIPELAEVGTLSSGNQPAFACKIEWMSKYASSHPRNSIGFETVKYIRNSHNSNSPINMCKEFNVTFDYISGSRRLCCSPVD